MSKKSRHSNPCPDVEEDDGAVVSKRLAIFLLRIRPAAENRLAKVTRQ